MAPDDLFDSPLGKALRRQKELQDTIKAATQTIAAAMQELERLKQFTDMYRSLETEETPKESSEAIQPVSTKLRGAAHGQAQAVFQSLALAILREVGRPMKSNEFVEEFRKRGHPLGGNEVRTAWNRLWEARAAGVLTHDPKLGYWFAGEPITEEAKERALIAAAQTRRRKKDGLSVVTLNKGKPKGPPRALNAEQIAAAERLLLAGHTLREVAGLYGIAIRTLALALPGSKGIAGLKAKYPDVAIPKRPYVYRPPKPGHKPVGRPRSVSPEQEVRIAELREQGKSISAIAEELGMKRGTVSNVLTRLKSISDSEASK